MNNEQYITTIGLEIHLQISTKTKAFCGCINKFGMEPNSSVCPVCLGLPGSLPVLNQEYFKSAIKVALALSCKVSNTMKFDRKNYFYPDLPKNYQISQYDMPLSAGGFLNVMIDGKVKKIGITRVHMEEDAGKLIHDEKKGSSYVDFNRTGTPLLEIVSEPDITSPDEAYHYLTTLKGVLEYLGVSDCNMEEGSLRCDANISVRPDGQKELGVKVELKNMNTFKGVKLALEYEEKRQVKELSSGKKIIQQTRLWNGDKKITEPMRTKEEAHDYRYFSEPDLVPFTIDKKLVKEIADELPEMPEDKHRRFQGDYKISKYDASVLVTDKSMSDYFEKCVKLYPNAKVVVNWLTGDISKYVNSHNIEFKDINLPPEGLAEMLNLIDKGTISGKIAKGLLEEALDSGKAPSVIVKEKGLTQISDHAAIEKVIDEVISENKKVAEDYISGKENALGFLIGQVMKKTNGSANPQVANQLLKKKIEGLRK